ncbi:MAG: helix-turn-helix domain-containing protein [Bdellovibrionaceae bacterium]|nr:helix-turn-helix domain-containing protein [Pseudobdellovibrionaceae bacterium]MCB9093226.1 helix-turn-helix domain-containing protein [Halobacteriovoraceae bacterium]
MATKKDKDPLKEFREQVRELVPQKYESIDDFCLNETGIPKSTMSRLLSGKRTEFRFATLQKIAEGLGKKLVIRLE